MTSLIKCLMNDSSAGLVPATPVQEHCTLRETMVSREHNAMNQNFQNKRAAYRSLSNQLFVDAVSWYVQYLSPTILVVRRSTPLPSGYVPHTYIGLPTVDDAHVRDTRLSQFGNVSWSETGA